MITDDKLKEMRDELYEEHIDSYLDDDEVLKKEDITIDIG